MLRSTLIYLSKANWAKNMVTHWKFAWRAASRFVTGEKLEDAITAIRQLNARGIDATIDHLGEHTTTLAEAEKATSDILDIFTALDQSRVRANVSIKLSQIGLGLDNERCQENLLRILETARSYGNFVRIDMEDSSMVDATLKCYFNARKSGYENTGVVIQSLLYRSEKDLVELGKIGARVRLCKGAYNEPASVAYPKKADVDAAYDRCAQILIQSALENSAPQQSDDGRIPPIPGIASHDPVRIQRAMEAAKQAGLGKRAIEFQMLYGIRRDLQEQISQQGYPVRIYVPYGTQWYPYFVRRLAERPANVWFFVSNFFHK